MTPRPDLPTYHELRQQFESVRSKLVHAEQAARESELRRVALQGEVDQLRLRLGQLERRAAGERTGTEGRRRELESANREAEQARRLAAQRQRDLEQALGIAMVALRSVGEDIERVEKSTAWRVGHRATRTAARARLRAPRTAGAVSAARDRINGVIEILAARRGELSRSGPGTDETEPDEVHRAGPEAKSALAALLRDRLGPVPERPSWPGVSIIVRNHDRAALLEALLDGLRATDYPALELVVIDLASTDRSLALLAEAELPFPLRVYRKDVNLTPAAAGNEAAELAEHPLLLFLDPAADPVEPGWCKELVDGLLSAEAAAIGATLLRSTFRPTAGEFPVAQRGVVLGRCGGLAAPELVDAGQDLFGSGFGTEATRVASSASCLLVDRSAFWRVGGFDTAYGDRLGDVDLGLSLIAAGSRIACSGRSVVIHDGEGVVRDSSPGQVAQRRLQPLSERWGPALRRELRLGLARCDPDWVGGESLHVALARTSSDPASASEDHHVAAELGRALGGLGWQVSYLERREDSWYALTDGVDVLIALSDDFEPRRLGPGVTAIAWIRAWPERWLSHPDFDRYDIVLAASASIAEVISGSTGREPVLFPLATNASRFAPGEPVDEFACDYCVACDRDRPREIDEALAPRRGERVSLYGQGWGAAKWKRCQSRGPIPDERLPEVYSSTGVLIDDDVALDPDHGTLPPRVFDALASGTTVITSRAAGAHELFDGEFPVWSDAATLRAQLDALLGAPERRRTLARRYRRRVLEQHTYVHRAETLRDLIRDGDERLSFCLKIGAPDWRSAARWGDLYLARDLERALKRRGHRCLVQVASEWDEPAGLAYDVAVHIKGRSVYAPRAAQFNVLWLLSHPTELSDDEAGTYDLVCVASSAFAAELQSRLSVPVAVLEQATDPWRFYPDPDPVLAHDLVFVGNARGARRPVLDDLLPTRHDLAVWGSGLADLVDARQLQGDWFANEELRKLYSSAKLVLCDHWEDMRRHGFASNRLYDAVASGAVVVTDDVSGLDGRFGDAVVPYATADELQSTLNRLLASDDERVQRARGARERVLRGHTFDHRAQTLIRLIADHSAASGHRLRVLRA